VLSVLITFFFDISVDNVCRVKNGFSRELIGYG
jgi:hypothetical protein